MTDPFATTGSLTPRPPRDDLGGPEWGGLIDALVATLDAVVRARPPAAVTAEATRRLREAATLLAVHEVPEAEAPANQRSDLPRRGHPLYFPVIVDAHDETHQRGRVRFAPFQHGHNGAAHGGMIGLFFDDVIGCFVAVRTRTAPGDAPVERVRTVSLHVDYRGITPIDVPLDYEVRLGERDGRKIPVTAALRQGDRVCAEATALMVVLLPGQQ